MRSVLICVFFLASTLSAARYEASLYAGEGLMHGEYLRSPNGRYSLQMLGNLQLTDRGNAIWTSGNASSYTCTMQGDGDLILKGHPRHYPGIHWHSGTSGHGGAYLTVQDNGKAVIIYNNSVIWSVP
jgi:hypothetical protein